MLHDVFISYSSNDKPIADGVCANLEAIGLRCWIAPRDIDSGEDWPTAIAKAIAASQVMVLVFSAHSNSSEQVSRELFLAANSKLVIIPFKIENVQPEPGKLFYLGSTHWLDAMNPPTQMQINRLVKMVGSFIKTESTGDKDSPVLSSAMSLDFRLPLHRKPGWVILTSALVLVAVLVITGFIFLPKLSRAPQPALTQVPMLTSSLLTTKQPTLSSLSQNQNTSSPAGTPVNYLYREDFNDPQFDGILPPDVEIDSNSCSNLKILQANGSLTFEAPAHADLQCGLYVKYMNGGVRSMLSDIKAVEFDLNTSPDTPLNHPSFSFMLGGSDNDQKTLFFICGLNANQANCSVKKEQKDIYRTRDLSAKPGESFTFRIEVTDPEKMVFRFLANSETIGEFTLPTADVPAYKNLFYGVAGGPVGMSNPTTGEAYLVDYIAIEQR